MLFVIQDTPACQVEFTSSLALPPTETIARLGTLTLSSVSYVVAVTGVDRVASPRNRMSTISIGSQEAAALARLAAALDGEVIAVLRRLAAGTDTAARRSTDVNDPSLDQDLLRKRTWLDVRQTAAYLGFPSEAAVREWATRHGIRKGRRGRTLVFRRTDLDRAVQSSEDDR